MKKEHVPQQAVLSQKRRIYRSVISVRSVAAWIRLSSSLFIFLSRLLPSAQLARILCTYVRVRSLSHGPTDGGARNPVASDRVSAARAYTRAHIDTHLCTWNSGKSSGIWFAAQKARNDVFARSQNKRSATLADRGVHARTISLPVSGRLVMLTAGGRDGGNRQRGAIVCACVRVLARVRAGAQGRFGSGGLGWRARWRVQAKLHY